MNEYEIRILRHDNQPLVISSRFLGDFHAIRRGQSMAQPDEGVEIWRGMTCLYRREALPTHLSGFLAPGPETNAMHRGMRPGSFADDSAR